MEFFEPWKIQLALVNLADKVDLEGLANEIFLLHNASPRESITPYSVTPVEFPLICEFRDGILSDIVVNYIREVFSIVPESLEIDTFGKWFEKDTELGDHLHGNSCVTSVFYPYTYQSGMMLHDPRFNASRGYSRRVRDTHFGSYFISPKAGDLVLMPSYVQHRVPVVKEQMRLSLINDYHFI